MQLITIDKIKTHHHDDLGDVRTYEDEGEFLFCLSDICKVLAIKNHSKVKSAILQEFLTTDLKIIPVKATKNKVLYAFFITQSQLYFILRNYENIKTYPFQYWLSNEILPSIRKKDYYRSKIICKGFVGIRTN